MKQKKEEKSKLQQLNENILTAQCLRIWQNQEPP